jgi:superfamily II DNA or RNA helicase
VQAIIEAGTESVEWVAREFVGTDLCDKRLDRRYFKPKFLLGLTATPERTDGADLLALCDDNLVYRCDVTEGIRQGLLCPFRYFGVPDTVDYRNIPSRNKNFDQDKLTEAVATQARAANALDQYRRRCGKRTIAFCVSQYHADFMANFFRGQGISAAAVHAGATSAPRSESLEALRDGSQAMLCAVDMFNEGVDVPELDTVMMLRPTEARIIWLQQFGRGLRRSDPLEALETTEMSRSYKMLVLLALINRNLFPGSMSLAELAEEIRTMGRRDPRVARDVGSSIVRCTRSRASLSVSRL